VNCPLCAHQDNHVSRSTTRADGAVRRTRQCDRCGHRWATLEVTEAEAQRADRVRKAAAQLLAEIGEA